MLDSTHVMQSMTVVIWVVLMVLSAFLFADRFLEITDNTSLIVIVMAVVCQVLAYMITCMMFSNLGQC